MDISGRDNVLTALTSPDLTVTPAVPPADAPLTLAWLRATVARFSRGPEHGPRRGYAQAALDQVDPAAVRATARRLTAQTLAAVRGQQVELMTAVARSVPVRALAEELGLPGVAVDDVATVARVYLTGRAGTSDGEDRAEDRIEHRAGGRAEDRAEIRAEIRAADEAVARLVAAVGGGPDEASAALVGVLVQSYEATAGLIGNACAALLDGDAGAPPEEVVAATLHADPPTTRTRRMAIVDIRVGHVHIGAGETVFVGIGGAGLPFGAGPHACPGAAQAQAIAEGVLEAVRGCRLVEPAVTYLPAPAVRVPARLPVVVL